MSPNAATARGFIAIFFWGTSIVAGRLIMGSLGLLRGPLAATLVSGTLGTILVLARRASRQALRGLGARYWLACGGLFVSYLVAYNLGTGLAAGGRQLLAFNMLNYLWPITTLVFSALFSQRRVRWWIAPGMAAGLAGTALALWSQNAGAGGAAAGGGLVVYGLGLYCGIAWGLYSALGRRLVGPSAANPVPLLFLATAAAASFLTPILSSACIALVLDVAPGWRFWLAALLAVAGAAVCRAAVREPALSRRPRDRI